MVIPNAGRFNDTAGDSGTLTPRRQGEVEVEFLLPSSLPRVKLNST